MTNTDDKSVRQDHNVILDMVARNTSALDLGCGDGELLSLLAQERNVSGCGIDLEERAIHQCVEKGLSVFHGDIDSGIADYGDRSFDYVILNQTLPQVQRLEEVFNHALRVGRKVIVGVPNFADLESRLQIFFKGKAPVTPSLPYQWYSTPNLHFCSLSDFTGYCRDRAISIERVEYLFRKGRTQIWPNLLAQTGIFLLNGERP
jgi:methionine biosynthesis protein MetW